MHSCQTENLPFNNLTNTQLFAENHTIHPIVNPKIQCDICTRTIAKNHRKIKCEVCNNQRHIKCNQTDVKTYNKIINENLPQICCNCERQNNNILQNLPNLNVPCNLKKTTVEYVQR